jgi:hypothetical protein
MDHPGWFAGGDHRLSALPLIPAGLLITMALLAALFCLWRREWGHAIVRLYVAGVFVVVSGGYWGPWPSADYSAMLRYGYAVLFLVDIAPTIGVWGLRMWRYFHGA